MMQVVRGGSRAIVYPCAVRTSLLLTLLLSGCNDATLSVSLKPPAVTITEPAEGATFGEGVPLTLVVQASDRETPTERLAFTWSLEDGTLLDGEPTFADEQVSWVIGGGILAGDRTLSILVTDADAMSGEDAVQVHVTPPPDQDVDGDGHDALEFGGDDCDDADPDVHPDAEEACDGLDQDCDGAVDEDAVLGTSLFYADSDGDGFGATDGEPLSGCEAPDGFVPDATDCDDTDASVHPEADELCNLRDEDCDGVVDEDPVDAATWYADADADGYGDAAAPSAACAAPSGTVENALDCQDGDPTEHPSADELCDGDDDDCDGAVDEADAIDAPSWYADADGDLYGAGTATTACAAPRGQVATDTDCDDTDSTINPAASELCDGADQDCDGDIDEGVLLAWHADADGDGYGDPAAPTSACSAPSGYVADDTDCDDADASENPAAAERCDLDDDDCDGTVDEADAVDAPLWYLDADGDTFGDPATGQFACSAPVDHVADATDCDDADEYVFPTEDEVCEDGVDQDCDGRDVHCPLAGLSDVSTADGSIYSSTAFDRVGAGGARCGDLDGDGLDDILVIGQDGLTYGKIWAFYTGVTGSVDTSTADVYIRGDSTYDDLGLAPGNATGGEDLNGDGLDDLAIGAPSDDLMASSGGTIYVFYGSPTSTYDPGTDADYLYASSAINDYAGGVALIGDVNGDRYAELLVGVYGEDTGGSGAGSAYLNYGPLTGYTAAGTDLAFSDLALVGEDAADGFGWAVAEAGDWDGDGFDDLLVSAYKDDDGGTDAGAAYVFTAASSGTTDASAADFKVYGEAAGDRFGYSLTAMGDADQDGYADVAIAAYLNDDAGNDAGAAYIVTGGPTGTWSAGSVGTEITGAAAADNAGYSLSGGGDVDGDGWTDLVIGAPYNDYAGTSAGATYLFYGPIAGGGVSTAGASIYGEGSTDYAGQSATIVGDTDGDGCDDLLIGAPGRDTGRTDGGEAFLILGGPR